MDYASKRRVSLSGSPWIHLSNRTSVGEIGAQYETDDKNNKGFFHGQILCDVGHY
jgi:hypothetical protein